MAQAPLHAAHVGAHDAAFGHFAVGHRAHEVGGHHRGEQACDHQRSNDGEYRGPPELLEELAGDAGHEGGGQKHRHQGEGGGDDGHADLVGGLQGCLQGRLAHAQVASDVLDLDDGIVHQDAHHQSQGQQGDGVEGEAEPVHAQEGGNHRQGQGQGGDEGGAPVAQEPPHHQHGQQGALVEQLHGAVEVLLDGGHVVVGVGEAQLRVGGLQFGHGLHHAFRHRDLAGAPGARDFEADHRLAVEQGHRAALGGGVGDGGDALQAHAAPAGQGDVHGRQGLGAGHGGNGAHSLLAAAHVAAAARGFQLGLAQLARDVRSADPQGRHALGVQLHAQLAGQAAHALDGAHALHRQQAAGHGVVHQPAQGLLVEGVGRKGPRPQGAAGGEDLGHHRIAHVGGEVGAHSADGGAHLGLGLVGVLLKLELDGDAHLPVEDGGVHLLDLGQGRNAVLQLAGDLGFQGAGGGAGQAGADRDHRQFDVREILDAGAPEGQQAGQGEQGEQKDRRDGVADGEGGEVHGALSGWSGRGPGRSAALPGPGRRR